MNLKSPRILFCALLFYKKNIKTLKRNDGPISKSLCCQQFGSLPGGTIYSINSYSWKKKKRIMIQISVCKCDCVTPEVGGRSQQAFISTTKAHFTVESFHTIWRFNPISAQSLHRGTACHPSLEELSPTTLISCSIKHVMSCNHFTAKYGRGFVTP